MPFGPDTAVLDLEDFLVSQNILPLGSLIFVLFCSWKNGWGWDKFLAEANSGTGLKFPRALHFYMKWILPLVVLFIFVMGYIDKFA